MSDNIRIILDERGSRYGDYKMVSITSQMIKNAIKTGYNYNDIPQYVQESLDMIANKLSRIVNGDYKHLDSYIDVIGYTQLMIDEIEKEINESNR